MTSMWSVCIIVDDLRGQSRSQRQLNLQIADPSQFSQQCLDCGRRRFQHGLANRIANRMTTFDSYLSDNPVPADNNGNSYDQRKPR